jgi:hypothetical protein
VSTFTFSPDEAHAAAAGLAVGAFGDGGALVAGALDAGGALCDVDSPDPELPVFLPHAAASSAVHSNAVVPTA